MLLTNRIIWSDNGTNIDISNEMASVAGVSKVLPIVAAQDYIYLGSELPFNHRYISVSVANDQTSAISAVDLWNGSTWVAALDVQDFTQGTAGKTLSQSGHIMWTPDPTKSWMKDNTNHAGHTITGLSGASIFNLYWVRLTFSADLKATTALQYIGHKFADDNDLRLVYPDLIRTAVYTQFSVGKTSWEEQHIMAAETIIRDLKQKGIVKSGNQVLDWRLFTDASVHKLAEIIYNSFGQDYRDLKQDAAQYYQKALSMVFTNTDQNKNARLDEEELVIGTGYLRR